MTTYTVNETGVTFEFNDLTKQYSQRGGVIDPRTLSLATPRSTAPETGRQMETDPDEKERAGTKNPRTPKYDPYYSDLSESEGEDEELALEDQLALLQKYGGLKHAALSNLLLNRQEGAFALHHPHDRKSYAAHRTSTDDPFVTIDRLQQGVVGQQRLNLQHGTGHFVTAGGNKEDRPEDVHEPPAEYREIFETLKTLGKDDNAPTLLTKAGVETKVEGGALSDRQIAATVLYCMNTSFDATLPRSQLTETLGKLLGIFASETARAFEATGGPYDTTLLIKACLTKVTSGDLTLRNAFYRGKGGWQSVFLGAPSKEDSPKGIGGAEQLRNPLAHREAFERQMAIFPTEKEAFKKFVSGLKTGTVTTLPQWTKQDKEKAEAANKADQLEEATEALAAAKRMRPPKRLEELNDFMNDRSGRRRKTETNLKKLMARFKGNEEAIEKVTEASEELGKVKALPTLERRARSRSAPERWAPPTGKKRKGAPDSTTEKKEPAKKRQKKESEKEKVGSRKKDGGRTKKKEEEEQKRKKRRR